MSRSRSRSRDRGSRSRGGECNVYVAKISSGVSTRELDRLFSKYGRVRDMNIKSDYGFVLYDDPRDAADAIRDLDGYNLDGRRLIVERAKGSKRERGTTDGDKCFNCGKSGHFSRDCPEPKNSGKSCYRCGVAGHIERDCTQEPKSPRRERRARSRSASPRARSKSPVRARSRSRSKN